MFNTIWTLLYIIRFHVYYYLWLQRVFPVILDSLFLYNNHQPTIMCSLSPPILTVWWLKLCSSTLKPSALPEDDNGMTLRKALDQFQLQSLNVTLFAFQFCVRTLGYRNVTRAIGKTKHFFPISNSISTAFVLIRGCLYCTSNGRSKGLLCVARTSDWTWTLFIYF